MITIQLDESFVDESINGAVENYLYNQVDVETLTSEYLDKNFPSDDQIETWVKENIQDYLKNESQPCSRKELEELQALCNSLKDRVTQLEAKPVKTSRLRQGMFYIKNQLLGKWPFRYNI